MSRGPWKTGSLPERESRIQSKVKELLRKMGFTCYDTSQPFKALITAGVPDLLAFHPRRGLVFIEVKARDGKQSKAQREFQAHCEAVGVPYVLGGVDAVAAWLNREVAA